MTRQTDDTLLYYSHGLGEAFCNYGDYFNGHQDDNAICYLTLANEVIHQVNPKAITIAEEVSGMPGLAAKVAKAVCLIQDENSKPTFKRSLKGGYDQLPEAPALYRKLLAQQPDSSVTIISVGFSTNLAP